MKKLFFAFAAVAVLFAACSKENPSNDNSIIPEESSVKVYTLSATMPQTKATVNTDEGVNKGQFLWESTDQIAVYDNEQNVYQVFTATGSGANVTFTFTATDGKDHDFTSSTAYYPASRVVGTTVSTYGKINSVGDVPMTATNNGGNLEFDYEAAVVKLTVKNVPSFAESVEFVNNGNSYAAEVSHSVNEDMTFYFAASESASASSEINIYDTNNNMFVHKPFSLKGGSIVNGALIPLKTSVGQIMLFNDSDNRAKYVKLLSNDTPETNNDFAELYDLGNGTKYRMIPSKTWTTTGSQVTVEVYGSDTSGGSFTSTKVFLYREFEFTVGASSISTSYRIYIEKNKTGNSQFNYSDCWAFLENKDNSSDQPLGTWGGTKMNKINDNIFYIDVPASSYGKKYYLSAHVNQNTNDDWHPKTYDNERLKITLNRDIKTTIYAWDNGYNLSFGNTWDTSWDWE